MVQGLLEDRDIGYHPRHRLTAVDPANKELTFDLARLREAIHQPVRKERPQDKAGVRSELEQLIPGATLVGTKGFGEAVIRRMDD